MSVKDVAMWAEEMRKEIRAIQADCDRILNKLDDGKYLDIVPSTLYAKTVRNKLREKIQESLDQGYSHLDVAKAIEND